MTERHRTELMERALRVREHIIRMSTNGGCFIGASLSCADLLVYLYSDFLRISPATVSSPDRDYLLLSKGHDVPALYGTIAELGYIDRSRLSNHLNPADSIYWHPNRAIPGVEFHSGSLGHLLSVGIGIALDVRRSGGSNRVVVITGDGELNEGSMWEGFLVAASKHLDNLAVVVDRNRFQANLPTEELLPLEPLEPRFAAFGWQVMRCNGHNFDRLEATLSAFVPGNGKPTAIIADTIRGKGLPSIEERADRWFVNFSDDDAASLLRELHGEAADCLLSEPLMVR